MAIVKCKICNIDLTSDLEILLDLNVLNEEDGEEHIPKDYYYLPTESEEYYTGSNGKIIINKNDIKNFAYNKEHGRLNGCCRLDGYDGINLVCNNGHEIATEKSDCWMPHAVIFEKDLVVIS